MIQKTETNNQIALVTAALVLVISMITMTTMTTAAYAQQAKSIKFVDGPSLRLNAQWNDKGLATSESITSYGTVVGSGGTAVLTSTTNVFSICEDNETGELSNTQNVESTISSDPVTIKPGRQSFEITTQAITQPIGDGGCQEGQQTVRLNFVQFLEPVLTIQTKNGQTLTYTFPSVP
jgi:hypothetical protein